MKRLTLILLVSLSPLFVHSGTLPNGFAELRIADGLDGTTVNYAPDGRLFVTQKKGIISVIKNGVLLSAPFLDIQSIVDNRNERGLQSMVFDPDFQTNGYIYIYYCKLSEGRNIVTRVQANGDVALAGSETLIVQLDPLPGSIHNGGAMFFKGGKLFIATGEGSNSSLAQSTSSLLGKVLRINKDGTIPTDNPFYESLTGQFRLIYAMGLRNPFRAAVQPGTEKVFINDVGASLAEEINELFAGKNYGWPLVEGKLTTQVAPANYQDPIYAYNHTQGCAIGGGAFYNPQTATFPSKYVGKYFFGDYCSNYIKVLDPATGQVIETFATNVNRPISFTVGNDGAFYYLARGGLDGGSTDANTQSCCSEIWRVNFTNSGVPTISAQPRSQTVTIGGTASFVVGASGNAPLNYQWQRNGQNINGATNASYQLTNATLLDNNAVFRVIVTNNLGTVTSDGATLTVSSDLPPVPVIELPTEGYKYAAGTTLVFSGSATDPEDGTLPASAFTWEINFHHDTHTHPALPPTSGITSGSYALSANHEPAPNVWYRIYLTVTDSKGQSVTVHRDVYPIISTVTLQTNQTGLNLLLDGTETATPVAFTGVAGIYRTISAPLTQTVNATTYNFLAWSDGGAAEHVISTPSADQTLTAHYLPILLEAEYATLSGATTRWGYTGFTGTGYVDIDLNTGGYIEWTVYLPVAGTYAIDFRYANGALTDRPMELKVNGVTRVASVSFNPAGTWNTWATIKSVQNLNAGQNTIRVTSIGANGPNFDNIKIYQENVAPPVVIAPVFTPAPGTYTSAQQITISSGTSGAQIYYTTDGTTPSTSSTPYGGAVSISASTTLKAIATKSGMTNSAITAGTYTINSESGTPFSQKLEAEDALLSGVSVKNNLLGFSGTGFADYDGTSGTYIEWIANVPEAGTYKIDFRFSNGGSKDRPLEIKINGVVTEAKKSFPVTGTWSSWSIVSSTVNFIAGQNKIRATTTGLSGGNMDYILVSKEGTTVPTVVPPQFSPAPATYSTSVNVAISSATAGAVIYYTTNGDTPTTASNVYATPLNINTTTTVKAIAVKPGYNNSAVASGTFSINTPPAFDVMLEAEQAVLSGAVVRFGYPGWTGSGFADYVNASNDYVQWTVNVPQAGTYTLQFRYALPIGNRPLKLTINAVTVDEGLAFPATGSWSTWTYVNKIVTLNAGNNTVRTTAIGYSGGNIDHLKVSSGSMTTAQSTKDFIDEEVNPVFDPQQLILYPIPVREVLNVEAFEPIEFIQLVNMSGERLKPEIAPISETEFQINVTGFAPGAYVLMLKVGWKLVSRKLIIE